MMAITGSLVIYSCEEDLPNEGEPVIYYIRNTDPDRSDSLYVGAPLGNLIAIVGENLGGVRQIMFNDQVAELNLNYVTDNSILVNVPADAPIVRTDLMILTFNNTGTYEYPFKVDISAPVVAGMENEWAKAGETAVIRGNYFFEPLTVRIGSGTDVTATKITQTTIEFKVPDDAPEGPITVATNFGETVSAFHFHDSRNIILNYDDLTATNSWRYGLFVKDEESLDNNYVKFKGSYNAGERNEGSDGPSTYESQFWAMQSGREEKNFLPGEPADYSLKFECKVIEWDKSYLNFCWAPWDWKDSNQELWDNKLNARAIWGPWAADNKTFTTEGKWITVEIPMTDFKWAMGMEGNNVVYTPSKFNKNVTGSLSLWVLSAPEAADSKFEFYIDNIRVVPNKPEKE